MPGKRRACQLLERSLNTDLVHERARRRRARLSRLRAHSVALVGAFRSYVYKCGEIRATTRSIRRCASTVMRITHTAYMTQSHIYCTHYT